jgi:hypothetical protein
MDALLLSSLPSASSDRLGLSGAEHSPKRRTLSTSASDLARSFGGSPMHGSQGMPQRDESLLGVGAAETKGNPSGLPAPPGLRGLFTLDQGLVDPTGCLGAHPGGSGSPS